LRFFFLIFNYDQRTESKIPRASRCSSSGTGEVLVFVVGCLIIYSAYAPAIRVPVLIAAAVEKFALGLLVFFGPVKRTSGMTTSAVVDGVFAILYVVYLVGL
jgi:hypothetical protein